MIIVTHVGILCSTHWFLIQISGSGDLILVLSYFICVITTVGSMGRHVILVFKGYHNKIPLASKIPQNVTSVQ